MKGEVGIGLMAAIVIIPAVVLVIGVWLFYTASTGEEFNACKRDAIDKVTTWSQRMQLPGSGTFEDKFLVSSVCVDHIEGGGILFRGDKKIVSFANTRGPIQFVFKSPDNQIHPGDDPYSVSMDSSSGSITFPQFT